MAVESVEQIIQAQERLQSKRNNWHTLWQDLANFLWPRLADFTTRRAVGTKRRDLIYDSTGEDSAERFASGLSNVMTPEGAPWFFLKATDDRVNQDRDVKIWLEDTTRRLLGWFASPSSNFYPSSQEKYLDLGVFGTACQFIEDKPGLGPVFTMHFLGECFADVDDTGRVDTLYRRWKMGAKQALQMFGAENVGVRIRENYEKPGRTDIEFEFIHAVRPRRERILGRRDSLNMPWASTFIFVQDKHRIAEGGFNEFPFIMSRWSVNAREIYGRSPGMKALGDVKGLNVIEKNNLIAYELAIRPPLDIPSGGFMRNIDLRPGALNVRNPSINPNDQIRPIESGVRPDLGEAKTEQKRQQIRRAFYNDIFELIGPTAADGDVIRMSATEVAARMRDRLTVLGPIFSRLKVEDLGPLIFRSLKIMVRNGMTLPPPPALRGANLEVEYISPIAIAQGAGDVGSILQWVDAMTPLAQIRPDAMDRLNVDEAGKVIGDRLRVPVRVLRSNEQIQQMREQQAREAAEERQEELNQLRAKQVKDTSAAETSAQLN